MSHEIDGNYCCQDAILSMSAFWDSEMEGPEEKEFIEHVKQCPACRLQLKQMLKTVTFTEKGAVCPPTSIANRVADKIRPSHQKLLDLYRGKMLRFGVLTASFLLLVGVMSHMYFGGWFSRQTMSVPEQNVSDIDEVKQDFLETGKEIADKVTENNGLESEEDMDVSIFAPSTSITFVPNDDSEYEFNREEDTSEDGAGSSQTDSPLSYAQAYEAMKVYIASYAPTYMDHTRAVLITSSSSASDISYYLKDIQHEYFKGVSASGSVYVYPYSTEHLSLLKETVKKCGIVYYDYATMSSAFEDQYILVIGIYY